MIERNPSKRLGTIEELSNLVAYMLSDYSSWMNGEAGVFTFLFPFIDFLLFNILFTIKVRVVTT